MPRVSFSLDEQFSDLRSNQVAYNFTVENHGSAAINLISLTPRIPEGVKQIEVRDPSQVVIRTKYDALCVELTDLLGVYLETAYKEFLEEPSTEEDTSGLLKRLWSGIEDSLVAVVRFPAVFVHWYIDALKSILGESSDDNVSNRLRKALYIKLEDYDEAERAFKRFLEPQAGGGPVKPLFEAKLDQLAQLEAKQAANPSPYLATIEPE